MKIKEIRELSTEELVVRERELRETTFRLRLQGKIGQLEKPSEIRAVRRDIARIETVLTERKAQA
jgi:large subunit ribosomal protein L29